MPAKLCPVCYRVIAPGHWVTHKEGHRRQQRQRKGSTRAWRRLRERIIERDHHRCVICGATERLEVDHINGNWQDDRPENLRTVCFDHNPRGRRAVNMPTKR